MASIARKNLFEDIPRFLVAQAGIMFSVSLVTIQVGILDGFTRSTVRLIDQSKADLWVSHKSMEFLDLTSPLTLDEWVQVRRVPGVVLAEPLSIQGTRWRSPSGRIDNVRIYGFDPNGQLFANWKFSQGQIEALKQPYTVFVDRANQDELGLKKLGDSGEIASLPAKLVGVTRDTQSMASSAFVFTSLETANAYLFSGLTAEVKCTRQAGGDLRCINVFEKEDTDKADQASPPAPKRLNLSSPITYILVKAKPGQDLEALRRSLEAAIPNTRVHTGSEMERLTRTYWRERTGVGFILGLGAVVGFVVGMVVVSQILYSSVSDHLKEFGTLKAMGASDWVIYRVITEQALWMAILGYAPSILLCTALGVWTMAAKGIMILITPATAAGVFGITLVMCIGSAVFAIQKVTHVDPAIVFKA
jgi:putative ABC transport system permease protein